MLTASCPRCGRPTPLSLAALVIHCSACGFEGRVPPALEQSMQKAHGVLQSLDARGRQLDARQVKALSSSGIRAVLVLVPVLLVTVPAILWAALGALAVLPGRDYATLVFFLLPLAVVAVSIFLAMTRMRKSRRRLLEACAARPPEESGGTAQCHVCGAPLQASTRGIARCVYCSADNVVAPRLLAELGHRSGHRTEEIERQVRMESERVGDATRAAGLATLASGCLAPFLTVAVFIVTVGVTALIERDVDRSVQYALIHSDAGDCVAKVTRSLGSWRIWYGGDADKGFIPPENRQSLEGLQLQTADILSGKRVRVFHLKKEGRVVKAFSNPFHGNYVRIRYDDGTEVREWPQGTCILQEPAK